jgi:hypothetical protein
MVSIFRGFFRTFHIIINTPIYGLSPKVWQNTTNPLARCLINRDNFFVYSNTKKDSEELKSIKYEFETQMQEIENYIFQMGQDKQDQLNLQANI